MHLLNVATLEIEEFQPTEIPPYAILSHTWGNSKDEVTHRDISGSYIDFKHKPGFQKIKFCATQALRDGFQYCWVDTCCVDKSSSAELSEAINSMYSWYKNSEICYVYMVDVDAEQPAPIDSQFEMSRWFTRGWTLQELLAPRTCQFFDKKWRPIGRLEKSTQIEYMWPGFNFDAEVTTSVQASPSQGFENQMIGDYLIDIISRSTGIQKSALMRNVHSSNSLANRMSWASRRETTRVEDIAYCLLGIFDVNMPLLYGEGEKAFIRLQEEIIKNSTDHSILAWSDEDWPGRRKTFSGLLAPTPQGFGWILTRDARLFCGERAPKAYYMTNNGLRIQLQLSPVPCKSNEYCARLDTACTQMVERRQSSSRCFLIVKMVNPPDSYARVAFLTNVSSLPDHLFAPKWMNVRQFINFSGVSPMYEKVSRVRLMPWPRDTIRYRGIVTEHRFDSQNALILVIPGRKIEAKVFLVWLGRGEPSKPFGLRITGDGTQDLKVNFTTLASYSLEELQRCDLEWRPSVQFSAGSVDVAIRFDILDGEVEAKVRLC